MMEARRKTWGLRPTTLGQKLQRSLTHSRREQRQGLSECLRLRCGRRSDETKRVKSGNVHLKELRARLSVLLARKVKSRTVPCGLRKVSLN